MSKKLGDVTPVAPGMVYLSKLNPNPLLNLLPYKQTELK
jgi:hypothetical protein